MREFAETESFDMVIKNGTIIDVVEGKLHKANIGVRNGKIAAISKKNLKGKQTIDASGMMVSPGFIDFHSHVDGSQYAAECIVRQGGTTTLGGERSLNGKVIQNIEEEGFIINHGFFVSQPFVLRDAVGIRNIYRPADRKEIRIMADLAARFMEAGACGICFPLELIPGVSSQELFEIAKVAKAYDKPVTIHLRKDGREALETFDEIFELAVKIGVKIHILELMYMVGMAGTMPRALALLDKAIASGLDITADSGVYDAFTVCIGTGVFDEGWQSSYSGKTYQDLIVSSGIHIGERCDEKLFRHIRQNSPSTLVTAFVGDRDAVPMAIKKEYVFVSTNAADGPCYPMAGSPEMAGTYPRLIGNFVRDEAELSFMEAIRKITILPARRFHLDKIGSLEIGKNADVVIFEYEKLEDRANYVNIGKPDEPPTGIKWVIVNGNIVVEDGRIIAKERYGRLIKI